MNLFKHAVVFIVPLFALIVMESIHRFNIKEMGGWITGELTEVLVSYLLCFAIFNLFYFYKQKLYLWISFGLLLIWSALACISQLKTMYRSVPLHPSDLLMLKEAFSVKEYLYAALDWKLNIVILGLIAAVIILIRKINLNHFISVYISSTMLIISGVILSSFYMGKPLPIEKYGGITTYPYAQSKHYDKNGFPLGLFLLSKVEAKKDNSIPYTRENVLKVKRRVEIDKSVSSLSPNVLYIMSESFWDPTIIDSLKLERDPIPFFRQLKEQYTHGEMVVTVFGGNTGNTEFEALTGMSLWFLGGSHIIPFNKIIDQPVDSMASILTRQGYRATAMHPFNRGYYNRYETYRKLGFQNYIPPEYMYSREKRGKYVNDEVLMKQVVDLVEASEQPVFVHAVTMENHGPYTGKRYDTNTIAVEGPLSADNKRYTEDFVQGLTGADASLKYLIGELERMNEPTVVVFFGDHLPYLGRFAAYKQLGFIKRESAESYEDFTRIHTTPFLIWNNLGFKKEELRMSSNFVTPYVLNRIQKEGNTLTDYLQQLMKQQIRVTPSPQFNEIEGVTEEMLKPYQLLQTDSLLGEKFAYDTGITVEQEDFHYGKGRITLDEVQVRDAQLEIKGAFFVPASKVLVNGVEVQSQYVNPETLTAAIPDNASGQLHIEVVVMDEYKNKILEKTKRIAIVQSSMLRVTEKDAQ